MRRDPPAILVLAAGASRRMRGEDKLLRAIDGTPLILRAVQAACAASGNVVVALPPEPGRGAWLSDLPATLVEVPDRSMSASIANGVAACPAGAVLIHLADMPEIGAEDLLAMVEAWRGGIAPILRAASKDGQPGHPVVFDASLRPELMALRGDAGARPLLGRHAVDTHRLPGNHALIDLDTPEDWDAWNAMRRART